MPFTYDAVTQTIGISLPSNYSMDLMNQYLDSGHIQIVGNRRQYFNPPTVNAIVISALDFRPLTPLIELATTRRLKKLTLIVSEGWESDYATYPRLPEIGDEDDHASEFRPQVQKTDRAFHALIRLVSDNNALEMLDLEGVKKTWDHFIVAVDGFHRVSINTETKLCRGLLDAIGVSKIRTLNLGSIILDGPSIIGLITCNRNLVSLAARVNKLAETDERPLLYALSNAWALIQFRLGEYSMLKRCGCGAIHSCTNSGSAAVGCLVDALIERHRQHQWRWVHRRVLDIAMALAPLHAISLTPYLVLWIVDWIAPMSWRFHYGGMFDHDPQHIKKLRLIGRVWREWRCAILSR